jgi:hypothetical protein
MCSQLRERHYTARDWEAFGLGWVIPSANAGRCLAVTERLRTNGALLETQVKSEVLTPSLTLPRRGRGDQSHFDRLHTSGFDMLLA